jgi:hypothetical protein
MSELAPTAPTAPQAAKAVSVCTRPSIAGIICVMLCTSLFVYFAQNTGKTNNGKMPATGYLCWGIVACCACSTLQSIYSYFTAPPCKTS